MKTKQAIKRDIDCNSSTLTFVKLGDKVLLLLTKLKIVTFSKRTLIVLRNKLFDEFKKNLRFSPAVTNAKLSRSNSRDLTDDGFEI